jgi:tellurite resistance protein
MKDEVLGIISAVLIGVIVALVNKWSGVDGQEKMTTSSQVRQAIVDLTAVSASSWDGGRIKELAESLKTTLSSMTKAAEKDNPDTVKEALRATEVVKVACASAEAQGITSAVEEAKSPSIKKILPPDPKATVAEQITALAAQYTYNIGVYKFKYLNRDWRETPAFVDLQTWWASSAYKKTNNSNYQFAFLYTKSPLTTEVWATIVSYNKNLRVGGLVESVLAKKDATRNEICVATFSNVGTKALIAAGKSREFARAVIWTVDEMSPEAASDYFVKFILDYEREHIYSPSTGSFIAYGLDDYVTPVEAFSKA